MNPKHFFSCPPLSVSPWLRLFACFNLPSESLLIKASAKWLKVDVNVFPHTMNVKCILQYWKTSTLTLLCPSAALYLSAGVVQKLTRADFQSFSSLWFTIQIGIIFAECIAFGKVLLHKWLQFIVVKFSTDFLHQSAPLVSDRSFWGQDVISAALSSIFG